MANIISIGKAAEILGVHVQTLRNFEKSENINPRVFLLADQGDTV